MKIIYILTFLIITQFSYAQQFMKTLTAVSTTAPPLFYVENGKFKGIDVDIIKNLARILGYKVEFIEESWEKALVDTKQGKFDFIFEADLTEERKKFFYFTRPTMQLKTGFFKRKKLAFNYVTLDSFSNYLIGMGNGYVFENRLQMYIDKKIYKTYRVTGNDEDLQGLIKAAFGQIDFYICATLTCQYLIKTNKGIFPELSFLDYIEPDELEGSWPRFAFSKARENSEQLSKDFDRELTTYLASQEYKDLFQRYVKNADTTN